MSSSTKMILITSKGIVRTPRGPVRTPISRPYREKVENIFRMLSANPAPIIEEVLSNGRTVRLTTANFDKDNELVKPEIKPASITPSINKYENNDSDPVAPAELPKADVPDQEEVKEDSNEESVNENPVETKEDTNETDETAENDSDPAAPAELPKSDVPDQEEIKEDAAKVDENEAPAEEVKAPANTGKKRNRNKNKGNNQAANIAVEPEPVQ